MTPSWTLTIAGIVVSAMRSLPTDATGSGDPAKTLLAAGLSVAARTDSGVTR
jgi:hypothetical protein